MSDQNKNQRSNWHIQRVSETGSTNTDVMAAAAAGAPDRTVLRADFQSAGRGRLDRVWEAPSGANLLVSMLFRDVPTHPHQLTQAVALAAVHVARHICGVEVAMKWPNDLLIDDVKMAGILAQAGPVGDRGAPEHVVVGLGLNIAWAPPGATCLADSGWKTPCEPDRFMLEMLPEIDRLLARSEHDLHREYIAGLGTLHRRVRAQLPDDSVLEGRAVEVGIDGRLVVLDECAVTHHIDTADVVHLRTVDD